HGWGARIPGSPGVDSCACTHVFGTVASDAIQLTTAEIEGRRHVRAYMDIARRHGGQSNRPCLLDLGSYLGVRETRSLEADYTLTESDAMSGRRFPDAIANGTYPIDVHDPRTGRFEFSEPQGDFYQIPLACLVSNRAPSTVLAGRTISAGRGAFGAIRVMVNLNQTGEAAGVTAALAAAGRPVREVEPSSVRERLSELGAVIV
ncbi:MAG TPA: FAD-dependent oxidoreductase, partial [Armatimonadota bacterium]|nr:FAD-dependent oxidoreductase [Armatimonadota bacterium]